ncbi:hypothetical protein CHLRE_16g650800v5 [Chlamydomonas reinhardtii]|uniref:Mitochondrial import inner membrane translocase subunit n=2 Tax=Chlamydomonas TaxID=3052 RepID=A0A2K3CSU0_CHLRE|nr:uncharacterized protein CHLRE_16g650800v5 [Chlamydomonas reinhardtii]KAG2451930.1 hypothetical protein HYH02_003705 [Chlamydomonas schloesseri]PNW71355.1 hypothetical protein CHLRE_16g650800v5 [Chlamydomonas reinhardtii]|eukprot:KAG2451930.1 hypothetical protein HYH02_003705 [Chlamydomonas schloesseri]
MSFGGLPGAPGGKMDDHAIMDQVKSQLQMQMVQEFYQTVRDKCFKACLSNPGSSLSSNDQKCLNRCMDRYQDATNVITKVVLNQ